jgi:hypothetical protein
MSMKDRSQYNPSQRMTALSRTKAYKGDYAYEQNRKPFATEQTPGTGGFTGGIWQQQLRTQEKSADKARAESFRPEEAINTDVYNELYSINDDAYGGTSRDLYG